MGNRVGEGVSSIAEPVGNWVGALVGELEDEQIGVLAIQYIDPVVSPEGIIPARRQTGFVKVEGSTV